MLYYNSIDISEGIDVNKTSTSECIFVIIGIFYGKGLGFNQLFATAAMLY